MCLQSKCTIFWFNFDSPRLSNILGMCKLYLDHLPQNHSEPLQLRINLLLMPILIKFYQPTLQTKIKILPTWPHGHPAFTFDNWHMLHGIQNNIILHVSHLYCKIRFYIIIEIQHELVHTCI